MLAGESDALLAFSFLLWMVADARDMFLHSHPPHSRSIMYKTKLPFILVFNKTDVQPHDFALEWMRDFEAFQAALAAGNATESQAGPTASGAGAGTKGGQEPSYMNSLMNSMSLVLDEFYKNLRVCMLSWRGWFDVARR